MLLLLPSGRADGPTGVSRRDISTGREGGNSSVPRRRRGGGIAVLEGPFCHCYGSRMLDSLLRDLQADDWFQSAVAASQVQERRQAAVTTVAVRADLEAALGRLGIRQLYTHQAETLQRAREGAHVVVSTPTASGKTLCFNLPVLETVLEARERGRDAHALYLFPLKALEHDQLKNLHRLRDALSLEATFHAAILDGDSRDAERKRLQQQPPHLLLTNPDMLHAALLPGHERWSRFFAGLRWIVLDELHTYRGVFGSHVLQILRRLLRLAAHYGAAPQVLAASATIRNPGELAQQLFGLPFVTVTESGAPAGPRSVFLLDPQAYALDFATTLFGRCVGAGVKTIAFCKSRRATELLYTWALQRFPALRGRTSAYRSGYLAEERREIEAALFGGTLQGVVSTSALELGIDVGGMDACILVGYPGSIMSTWQRGGRAGRGDGPAALFLVAGRDALDQYYVASPQTFFRATPEPAVVDATNPGIRAAHLLCAGAEQPLRHDEPAFADLDWPAARTALLQQGALLQSVDGEFWLPLQARPHRFVDLRQCGETYSIHRSEQPRRVLGTIGGSRVFHECHEGAVYMHRGAHLQVTDLDLERKRVQVVPTDGSSMTQARSAKHTEILEILASRRAGVTPVHFGRLRITQRITGYDKRSTADQKLLGSFALDLPPTIYETEGWWLELDPALGPALAAASQHRMGSLHAIEHACIALSPLFLLCDAADLGGITFTEHPQVPAGAVFVYDTFPGGIGLTARTFELAGELLQAVLERLEGCDCSAGCPGCVHSPRCGAGNYPLDKRRARSALRLLLGHAPLPRPPHPPATPPELPRPAPAPGLPAALAPELPRVTLLRREPRLSVLDLETRYAAAEVGGWRHIERMRLALAVVYDETLDRFTTYHETEVSALVEALFAADLVLGFNVLRFDYAVLAPYTRRLLARLPTFDMLRGLRERLGFRVSLDNLARATLERPKSADGLQSLAWVRQGRLDLVEEYCRRDVELTRDLFRHALASGTLCFERRGVRFRTPLLHWERQRLQDEALRAVAARWRTTSSQLWSAPRPAAG